MALEYMELKETMKLPRPVPLGSLPLSYVKPKQSEPRSPEENNYSCSNIKSCEGWTVEGHVDVTMEETLETPIILQEPSIYEIYKYYFEGKDGKFSIFYF